MGQTKPTEIELKFSDPKGQVGDKPRKIRLKEEFMFTTKDPGVLSIKFTKGSPLEDGSAEVSYNTVFTAAKEGRFPFECTLKDSKGGTKTLGIASDPSSPVGGELEVGP